MKLFKKSNLKIILAISWSLFTASLIIWWWIWALELSKDNLQNHRMITYEGTTLLTLFLAGSFSFVVYVWQDHIRNEKLKLFFSIFSHDIKTSISRLRLQAEILDEEADSVKNAGMNQLVTDIMKLDLQLENSLNFAHLNQTRFYIQEVKLSKIVSQIRSEFPDLNIQIQSDALIHTDVKIFTSILRNVLRNAELHGKASHIDISIKSQSDFLEIQIQDNGVGFVGDTQLIGKYFNPSKNKLSNGFGLFICRELIHKMNGKIYFSNNLKGFVVFIKITGKLL